MAFVNEIPESCLTLAKSAGGAGFKAVHLLVMGLSGAGKSTFISRATGNTTIPTGSSIFGVTDAVQDYVLYINDVEVHLIDTPGFDDSGHSDHEVLDKIALWINTVYAQGWTIGGILYLYDITRTRLGASGLQNIRVLKAMTGSDRWQHISLISNKWRCSTDHQGELDREQQFLSSNKGWRSMLEGDQAARVCRFVNTLESARDIIKWHINQSFQPEIVRQMADPNGPGLSLGSTDAGRLISDSVMPGLQVRGDVAAQQRLVEVLGHRFDAEESRLLMRGMLAALAKARREQRLQKAGRWALRLTVVGGSILISLISEHPAALCVGLAASRAMEPMLKERRQMKSEQIRAMEDATFSVFGTADRSRSSSGSQ